MPRTINGDNHRESIRIPTPMVKEIDRIVKKRPELHYNRQQFIECAVREKIEKTRLIRAIDDEAEKKHQQQIGE
jgi:metal-responsive CopG/Arc/MetJ family transcriptional regulator